MLKSPDNVLQWLQLIKDENSLLTQDFLSSASDNDSQPDTSTMSQNTQDDVESVVSADHSKDSPPEPFNAAATDKSLTMSSGDDIQQYSLAHSAVYEKLGFGNSFPLASFSLTLHYKSY